MNRAEAYPWVTTKPPPRPRSRPMKCDRDCARCGYGPVGGRKRCPACMTPTGSQRGMLRDDGIVEMTLSAMYQATAFIGVRGGDDA